MGESEHLDLMGPQWTLAAALLPLTQLLDLRQVEIFKLKVRN